MWWIISFLFIPLVILAYVLSHIVSLSLSLPLSGSQVELLRLDVMQLLTEHAEGRPHRRVQGPALLHQVVHHRRTAVGAVHRVALLHPRNHLLQRLQTGGEEEEDVEEGSR